MMRPIWEDEVLKDEPLWRYFQPERFLEALSSRTLYFASARQFKDRFEGAIAVLPDERTAERRDEELKMIDTAFEDLRRLVKICCWHRANYESDAMWTLYAKSRKGVALCTTVNRLSSGLRPYRMAPSFREEVPFGGSIRYVDLHQTKIRAGKEKRFFYKHRAFEWEREFRVAVSFRQAEEDGIPVPEQGICVEIDATVLVESICVGPGVERQDRIRIKNACIEAGLECDVRKSTMLGTPIYE